MDKHYQMEADDEKEVNLLELLQVLVKGKMLIIKVCVVAVVASVLYSLSLPNIYSATAKVLPPQKDAGGGLSALLGQAGGLASLAAGGLGGGGDLYLGILKSRSVGDAVIRRLDLVTVYKAKTLEDARNGLEGAVKVQSGKDGIISITAENKDPKLAAQMANTIVDELAKTTIRLNLSRAGTERTFLERRLAVAKKDLTAAEDDLKAFSQKTKFIQMDAQAKASIEGIAKLKAELASKEVQLAVLSSQQTDSSPNVQAAQMAIKRLKGELGTLAGSGGGGEGIPSLGNVPSVGLDYARKLREFKTQEAIFEQLTKQYELAKYNEAKDTSSFQILDDAVVPAQKSRPKRFLLVLTASVMSFFLSICLVFLREYLAKMSDEDRKIIDSIKKQALSIK